MKSFVKLAALLLACSPCFARARVFGNCEQGGTTVNVSVASGVYVGASTAPVQKSFPGCTVTVYLTGTNTLTTIYSDNIGTALTNPFVASQVGSWFFYVENGRYDVKLSGGNIPVPFTQGDVLSNDPFPLVDVRTCGAKSDGITDNTTAIQSCLNSLTSGGTLVFPPGIGCYETRTVTPLSNTTIAGTGCIDIVDDGTTTGRSIYINGVTGVTVRDIKITSANALSRTGLYADIRIENASFISVLNTSIVGGSSTGIQASLNSTDLLIQGNSISETWADGIQITRGSARVRIIGNTINHTGDDGIGIVGYTLGGGTWSSVSNVTITGNSIYNITKLVGRGIALYGVIHASVTGNTIDTIYDAGIIVGATGGTDPVNSTHYPYQLTISNNTISNVGVGVAGGTRAGIYISFSRSVVATGNTIYSVPGDGISVSFVGKDIKVIGNDLSSVTGRGIITSQVSSSDARLILELFTNLGDPGLSTVGISEVTISNNTVRNIASNGVDLEGEIGFHSKAEIVTGNDVYKITGKGIFSNYSDNNIISNNRVTTTTDNGIHIAGENGTQVVGNSVVGTSGIGISLVSATNSMATGNYVATNALGGIYSDPTSSGNFITGNLPISNSLFQVNVDDSGSNTSVAFNNLNADYAAGYGVTGPLLNFASGFYVGGSLANQLIKRIAVFTATESPSTVLANTCTVQNLGVTGVVVGDIFLAVNKPSAQAGLSFSPIRIPSLGNAAVNFCNNTGSPITPTPGETYTFMVLH